MRVSEGELRATRWETHQGQSIGDLADEDFEGLDARLLAKLIAAKVLEVFQCLLRRQAVLYICAEFLRDLFHGQCVGRRRDGLVGLARDVLRLFLVLFITHGCLCRGVVEGG